MSIRIGQGIDVHAFAEGDHLMLGGVRVAHKRGVAAHSDGDVLIHALCDAIFGALAMGDIGRHFPPSDPKYKDAPSSHFLQRSCALMRERGYEIGNVDATLICEQPKITPQVEAIIKSLAKIMSVDKKRISVKATTTEKLGLTGREEGIAAMVVALLESN